MVIEFTELPERTAVSVGTLTVLLKTPLTKGLKTLPSASVELSKVMVFVPTLEMKPEKTGSPETPALTTL